MSVHAMEHLGTCHGQETQCIRDVLSLYCSATVVNGQETHGSSGRPASFNIKMALGFPVASYVGGGGGGMYVFPYVSLEVSHSTYTTLETVEGTDWLVPRRPMAGAGQSLAWVDMILYGRWRGRVIRHAENDISLQVLPLNLLRIKLYVNSALIAR